MKKAFSIVVMSGIILSQCVIAAAEADDAPNGRDLFTSVCSNCHGADAGGGRGPALKPQPAEELTKKLEGLRAGTYGKSPAMKDIANKYSPEQLKSVVHYIKSM